MRRKGLKPGFLCYRGRNCAKKGIRCNYKLRHRGMIAGHHSCSYRKFLISWSSISKPDTLYPKCADSKRRAIQETRMMSPADLMKMAESLAERIPEGPAFEEERQVSWELVGRGFLRCGDAE